MRRFITAILILGFLGAIGFISSAGAQTESLATIVTTCGVGDIAGYTAGSSRPLTADKTGESCVNAAVSIPSLTATFGATFPAGGIAIGAEYGGNLVSVGADSSSNLDVNCVVGCSGGTASNASSGVATSSTNGTTNAWLYGFNGTTWDQIQVDGSKNLKATVINGGTFAVQAAESGTWNITNVSGTVSLPTGAATAAKQPALGTAGTPSADVISVQGVTSMKPLIVDGSTVTQPVSGTVTAAQNTAANLNATVVGTGTFAVQAAESGTWNITNVSGTVSLPTGAATSANQVTNAAQGSTTSGQTGPLIQGAVSTSAPTYTNAKTSPLSLDTAGNLRVNVVAGGGSGGTSSSFGSTFPSSGTAIGAEYSGNMVALAADSSSNLEVNCAVGCAGGSFNNNADGVATSSTNGQAAAWLYGWNGTKWDRLYDDSNKYLYVDVGAGTVAATESGTWNITNVSGTVSLPTGAATAAKQPALGTAGSASSDVITVQGIASMTALKVDGSGVTQPVSGTVSITANSSVNLAQINGTTTAAGVGVDGAGAQRVTISNNSTGTVELWDGTNTATVKAASTSPALTDKAAVVALSPNPSPVCTGITPISQTTGTDVKTFTNTGFICSIVLVSATAQSIGLIEGTGSVCATGTAALIGGTSASMALAANGGFSAVSDRTLIKMGTAADHLCVLQSGSGNVSGFITWQDHS